MRTDSKITTLTRVFCSVKLTDLIRLVGTYHGLRMYVFGFVPLPRTNEAKYVHTLPVIRTDKAHFVRQFNRTKYPCKGCYFN